LESTFLSLFIFPFPSAAAACLDQSVAQFESGHWSSASPALRFRDKAERFPAAIHYMAVANFHALPPASKIHVSLQF